MQQLHFDQLAHIVSWQSRSLTSEVTTRGIQVTFTVAGNSHWVSDARLRSGAAFELLTKSTKLATHNGWPRPTQAGSDETWQCGTCDQSLNPDENVSDSPQSMTQSTWTTPGTVQDLTRECRTHTPDPVLPRLPKTASTSEKTRKWPGGMLYTVIHG